jgi:hypothetical protein
MKSFRDRVRIFAGSISFRVTKPDDDDDDEYPEDTDPAAVGTPFGSQHDGVGDGDVYCMNKNDGDKQLPSGNHVDDGDDTALVGSDTRKQMVLFEDVSTTTTTTATATTTTKSVPSLEPSDDQEPDRAPMDAQDQPNQANVVEDLT